MLFDLEIRLYEGVFCDMTEIVLLEVFVLGVAGICVSKREVTE